MSQSEDTGLNTKPWPILVDHYKETTDVVWVSDKSAETVHYHGTIPTNLRSFDKLIKNQTAKTSKLCVIYEAGPCSEHK